MTDLGGTDSKIVWRWGVPNYFIWRLARVKTSGNKKPPTFAEGLSNQTNQTNRTKTFEVFVFYF